MKIIERRGGISVQLRRPQWTGVSLLFLALQTLENRLSARLIGDPDDRILCLGAAKQATDVLIQKANRELEDAQKDKRNREVLQGRRAIKVYTDTIESSLLHNQLGRHYVCGK